MGLRRYPPTPCFFVTADSKGVADAFLITADSADSTGVMGFLRESEKVGVRREAQGKRRTEHAEG